MKLVFNVDDVLPRIAQCVGVVNSKNSLPILQDLLVETRHDGDGGNCILITGSDGETWLQIKARIESVDSDFVACISATDLHKALANLKGKQVEMTLDENRHVVTCRHANGHFQLPYEESNEYPKATKIDQDENIVRKKIGHERISLALEKAGFATAQDELRPVMNGVHFDFMQHGMIAVATDGHKLAKHTDKTIQETDSAVVTGFTLPKKPATVLLNVIGGYGGYAGDISMMFNDRAVVFYNNDFVITTRLIEGRYPNYDAVIPKDNDIVVTANRADFVAALKRVLPMSNTSSELVSVRLTPKTLTLSAVDSDFSKAASEHIECDYDGQETTMGFKGSAMLGVMQNIDGDNVKIMLKDPSRAGLFTPANDSETTEYVSLLMPMLIQND